MRVEIVEAGSRRSVDVCDGSRSRACERVPSGDAVFCAGRLLLVGGGEGRIEWTVEPTADVCPLWAAGCWAH